MVDINAEVTCIMQNADLWAHTPSPMVPAHAAFASGMSIPCRRTQQLCVCSKCKCCVLLSRIRHSSMGFQCLFALIKGSGPLCFMSCYVRLGPFACSMLMRMESPAQIWGSTLSLKRSHACMSAGRQSFAALHLPLANAI